MKFNNPGAEKFDPSRRDFLKKITLGALVTAIAPDVLAGTHGEQIEQNRAIKKSEIIEMENKGNLRDGFSRMKINIEFDDGKGEIIGAGSFFSLEDSQGGKAEFLSKEKHPELFQSGVDFNAIKKFYEAQGKEVTLLVAGAYYAPGTKMIEGVALEDGVSVGEPYDIPKSGLNGLLVIEDGTPRIEYVNQIQDLSVFLKEMKSNKADLFQQTSYLRPGGQFSSSKTEKWELRFFVEGSMRGVPKKGIINFSTDMTYTEVVEAMKKMNGFTIDKAIGLDTGNMSEGYFYDREGKEYLMIDEDVGKRRGEYTNIVAFVS